MVVDSAVDHSIPDIDPDTVAFLQYTSGSTGSPKGGIVTHKNLIHNSGLIQKASRTDAESEALIWMPVYHDMGLITGVVLPIHVGFLCHMMSPLDFIRDPLLWLKRVSSEKATHSGGPNFAYALCTVRFNPDTLKDHDLSSWKVAFTGAEPIHPKTMNAFCEVFGPYGFHAASLLPCYGYKWSSNNH